MQSRWVRRIAYMLLAAVVVVASCQAMAAVPAATGLAGAIAVVAAGG
jgi:hypothetical protein